MSSSIRFLGLALFAWAGVRAVSLGLVPGTAALAPAAEAATAPPARYAARSEFSAVPPPMAPPGMAPGQAYGGYGYPQPYAAYPPYPVYQAYPQPVAVPYYYPLPAQARAAAPAARPSAWDEVEPTPRPLFDGWGLAAPPPDVRLAASGIETRPAPNGGAAIPNPAGAAPPGPKRPDRLQLSAWALLRGSPGPGALATGGTLGGSQVGARLTYKFTPALAATLRSSSSVGGVRYAEVAGGIRWQPMVNVPIALNVERRFALYRWGGRNDFALFAEGGLYQTPIFGIANLDLYAQGGVVGLKTRDLFFDGAATFTRPVWKKFSAGLGVWGGVQPGLYRVDAGPRLTMDVGRGIRLHADYRQRLAGEAMPASGPALTIAGDF
jgi:hypothetical protein